MGTIIERKRDKGTRYTAQIRIKRGGKIVHQETETFWDRKKAESWIEREEKKLAKPGALEAAMKKPSHSEQATLRQAIDRYISESVKEYGKTKAQVLRTIRDHFTISDLPCSLITSHVLVEFGKELHATRDPSTVGNYFSHLSKIFQFAEIAWGYPLDPAAFRTAWAYLKEQGIVAKSKERKRRLQGDEGDRLMEHWMAQRGWAPHALPMHRIMPFAIFSTRRQEEICTIRWDDLDEEGARILVRKMKDPKTKQENDVWVHLVPEAIAIIKAMPKVGDRIFPYEPQTVSNSFTKAKQLLGMDAKLTFHGLRHEGISRLLEMGWEIAQVAYVSGHKSWDTIKRYAHMTRVDNKDRYENWKWMEVATAPWGTYESVAEAA